MNGNPPDEGCVPVFRLAHLHFFLYRFLIVSVLSLTHHLVCVIVYFVYILELLGSQNSVCVELGIAIALKNPVFLFRDDFRHCAPCEDCTWPPARACTHLTIQYRNIIIIIICTRVYVYIHADPLNLMCFAGCPQEGWRDHYYTSLEEISNPEKAFVKWLNCIE